MSYTVGNNYFSCFFSFPLSVIIRNKAVFCFVKTGWRRTIGNMDIRNEVFFEIVSVLNIFDIFRCFTNIIGGFRKKFKAIYVRRFIIYMVSKAFFWIDISRIIHNTDFNFIFSIQRFACDFGKIIGIKSIDMFFVVSFLSCFRCGYFRNDRAVFIGCHIDPVYLYICIANTRIFIVNSYAYVFIGIKPDLLIISHYPVALRFTDSDFRLFSFDHSEYIIGYSFTLICIFYIGAT